MNENYKAHKCKQCSREITEEEYEAYDGLCEECHKIEIDELDMKTNMDNLWE